MFLFIHEMFMMIEVSKVPKTNTFKMQPRSACESANAEVNNTRDVDISEHPARNVDQKITIEK